MSIEQEAGIAVIGAGVMGAGIAQVAALSGHAVIVIDQNADALAQGRRSVEAGLAAMVRKGRLEDDAAGKAVQDRICWTTRLADAAPCALAIEAIVERLDAKHALFEKLAAILPANAILASNTSSLPIAAIAEGISHPERVVGLHFFNPVPLMKLVEIIAAPLSDPSVIDAMAALMRAWGKHPVVARDVPGFIVNRVARPYYAEAFVALDEDVPAATVDHALTSAGGFRMGPLALADMIGHNTNFAVASIVHKAGFGAARFRPQDAQRRLIEQGALGRKSGRGVYSHDAALPAPTFEHAAPPPRHVALGQGNGMLAALCRAVIDPIGEIDGEIAVVDGVRLGMSDGRPLAARTDVDALVDIVRDIGVADTIIFSAVDDHAASVVSGLIQAGGRQAIRIADRPGLLVLRMLTQIANAAADAVSDGVADAKGVDEAMLYGANHPEGPLAWAGRFGPAQLVQILTNIAAATGDGIYAPSEGFRSGV